MIIFSLREQRVSGSARPVLCESKENLHARKRFPLAHYFKAGAICTNSYSIFTMLK